MTFKELVEFTGKTDRTVRNWIKKADLGGYAESAQGYAIDYTIDDIEKILNAGSMSRDAVIILMGNARRNMELANKPTNIITVKDNNVDYEIIGKMIGMAVAAAMTPVVKQLENISKPQLSIEAPKEDYFSLLAYCYLHKIKTNRSELAMHGRELRKMALNLGLELRKIPDERYGEVNSYPVEILDEYFTV